MQFVHRCARRPSRLVGSMTARSRVAPTLRIVGVQRAGTTAPEKAIQRPALGVSVHKWMHYFETDYQREPQWYAGHLAMEPTRCTEGRVRVRPVTGQATPWCQRQIAKRNARRDSELQLTTQARLERCFVEHAKKVAAWLDRTPSCRG